MKIKYKGIKCILVNTQMVNQQLKKGSKKLKYDLA